KKIKGGKNWEAETDISRLPTSSLQCLEMLCPRGDSSVTRMIESSILRRAGLIVGLILESLSKGE
ncbi:MAG: hypothetical protein MJA27_34470, partial [Pseudanabaenales cyanobacterium]|nr:hypothetical protein [Pseudanabaenales cyanobacterium]